MNKTQLVEALARRIGDRRIAASAVDGLLKTIVDAVCAGESVTLAGFGVFESRSRAARVARNPRTGETVAVPATTVPAFRPGIGFRAAVSAGGTAAMDGSPWRRKPTAATAAAGPLVEATVDPVAAASAKGAKAKAGKAGKAGNSAKVAKAVPVEKAKAGKVKKAKKNKAKK